MPIKPNGSWVSITGIWSDLLIGEGLSLDLTGASAEVPIPIFFSIANIHNEVKNR